ncbi:DegT/DnrJ/EryC1/StrS aminotransferase family protein [Kutzneria buriramensis]|uniref:Perosamine synthetase n=1 Tax=Kutzneria buriramensis TaxID=1045776 RepID=A0A3E0H148_9PSEU|nr:DegT/DnrJ/EryC1/StrS family aminotransferase [Kutzneria buriramensis]REH36385.1 perosamine synthetase [Kutzneria buriramensis]
MSDGWIRQVSPMIGDEEALAVQQVVASGWITEGPESRAFVAELKECVGSRFAVLAPNGTLALALGLLALDIGPGDEVLVPDMTFVGSASAVVLTGAKPVFVDVEPVTFQIDMADAERRLTPATKAVMPVHLYGTACDMAAVSAFADRHGLQVIEDAAQSMGVRFRGQHVGTFGDVGCFSFFADKTITTGEGGFVTCQDEGVYERLRLLRNQGRMNSGTFIHPSVGFNLRITDMQAALGRVQLRKLGLIIERKLELLAAYREALSGVRGVRVLGAAEGANHVPFRCAIVVDDAAAFIEHLSSHQIEPRTFFYPLHLQPAFASLRGPDDHGFPNAVAGYEGGICLPLHSALTVDDVSRIARAIRDHQEAAREIGTP